MIITYKNISFVNYNKIKSILLISKNFNLPSEISEYICHYILHISAQKIINNWYNHICIHNSNLVNLVCKLDIKEAYYQNSYINYYDLNDINVLRTFTICYKMIDLNISCHAWWCNVFKTLCAGIHIHNHSDIYYKSINVINLFHIKSRDYMKKLCNSIQVP